MTPPTPSGTSSKSTKDEEKPSPTPVRNVYKAASEAAAECSICLKRITDRAVTDTCHHEFDRPCLESWSEHHNTCPICREVYTRMLFNIQSETVFETKAVAAPEREISLRLQILIISITEDISIGLIIPLPGFVLIARHHPFQLVTFDPVQGKQSVTVTPGQLQRVEVLNPNSFFVDANNSWYPVSAFAQGFDEIRDAMTRLLVMRTVIQRLMRENGASQAEVDQLNSFEGTRAFLSNMQGGQGIPHGHGTHQPGNVTTSPSGGQHRHGSHQSGNSPRNSSGNQQRHGSPQPGNVTSNPPGTQQRPSNPGMERGLFGGSTSVQRNRQPHAHGPRNSNSEEHPLSNAVFRNQVAPLSEQEHAEISRGMATLVGDMLGATVVRQSIEDGQGRERLIPVETRSPTVRPLQTPTPTQTDQQQRVNEAERSRVHGILDKLKASKQKKKNPFAKSPSATSKTKDPTNKDSSKETSTNTDLSKKTLTKEEGASKETPPKEEDSLKKKDDKSKSPKKKK